jgi:hypothetical protein
MNYSFIILALVIFIIFWDHIFRQFQLEIRPSIFLQELANFSKYISITGGMSLAVLSSFYTSLFTETLVDLFIPIMTIVAWPYHIVSGYVKTSRSFYRPVLVYLGSATVTLAIFSGSVWYYNMDLNNVSNLLYDNRQLLWLVASVLISLFVTVGFMEPVTTSDEDYSNQSRKRHRVH